MTMEQRAGTPARNLSQRLAALLLPGIFVVLWSTGFVFGKLGMPATKPFTFLELRYLIVIAVLTVIALVSRVPWPKRGELWRIAVGGLFVHAGYLGGVFMALSFGVEAGVAALVAGLQPVLTAALAGPLLGERISARQWLGLALGFAGVVLVVETKLSLGLGTPLGMAFSTFAMLSITVGTLWQKRFGGAMDLRTGSIVQFTASALVTAPFAIFVEGFPVQWTMNFVVSLAWLCLVLSIGAITAMFVLIRRGKAAEVASLFFLVPPTTALIAWVMFGEVLEPLSFLGMAMVVAAVAMVTRGR
jgi:drug/metabolite transporter (DMT)-like permease